MQYFDVEEIKALSNGFTNYISTKVKGRTAEQYSVIISHYLRNQILKKVSKNNYEDIFNPDRIEAFHNYRKSMVVQSAIGNFLEYLKKDSLLDNRFPLEYPIIKRPERRKGDYLSIPAIKYIFSDNVEFDNFEEKTIAPCIYSLHFFCCFEQKHIINLKVSDLILQDGLIRNMRCNDKYPNLLQWIELNDLCIKNLSKYMEYRNNLNLEGDNLFWFEGKPISTDSINALLQILRTRKNNIIHIDSNVNGQVLIRSMILYSLVSSQGKSLSQMLQFQEWNEQIKQAHNEYMLSYLRSYNESDIQPKFSLDEILTGYIDAEKIFDNDEFSNLTSKSNEEDTNEISSLDADALNSNIIIYSEDKDLTMDDLISFDSTNTNNLKESEIVIQRLVRDSNIARKLKEYYNHKCQLCGYRLRSSNGGYISEAHHLKPYNRIHKGDDTIRNMIILCPNCHTQFDELFYAINPDTKQVHCIFEDDQYNLSELDILNSHELGKEYIEYAWGLFQRKKHNIL